MARTNEKRTTLHEYSDCTIKVNYFWSADDKVINWNDQVTLPKLWIHSKARIDLLEFTEEFEGLGKTMDFKVCELYINDQFIGEIMEAGLANRDGTEYLKCDVAVGYGY